ncbi:MAG: aminomethyltransferase family protein [Chitinispirillaceae bacterium]|nr:aminomethyltransferase family protein [Chitinispirillaceae bacterium]
MRVSPLKNRFVRNNASFSERYGIEVVTRVRDARTEYDAVRETVGITDFSFMQKFRFPEEAGLDHLDGLMAGNVAKIRFGRVLHTFLPDDEGMLLADCYIANSDDEFIVLCESIADDADVRRRFLAGGGRDGEDWTESHAVIGVDGYKAWEVVRQLFGADILGLPYLSIERYLFNDIPVRVLRCGKTSEFGYLIVAPQELAGALFDTVMTIAQSLNGSLCGTAVHNDLRLEGRFFNIFAEGREVRDPLALGLQWMIDFEKERFIGRDALVARRSAGVRKKIIGIRAPDSVTFETGKTLFDGDTEVGAVKAACYSYQLNASLGLALFESDVAYAGLPFHYGSPSGQVVQSISMPPIMPKSLTVKLDEL